MISSWESDLCIVFVIRELDVLSGGVVVVVGVIFILGRWKWELVFFIWYNCLIDWFGVFIFLFCICMLLFWLKLYGIVIFVFCNLLVFWVSYGLIFLFEFDL